MPAADDAKSEAGAVELDAEGLRLQLDAEKAKLRQSLADAESAKLARLLPGLPADAPKGQVTLGDKAGAFGPWRAHQVIDAVAREIVEGARGHLAGARVLVVEDRALLPGEWTAHQVRDAIGRARAQFEELASQAVEMGTALAGFDPDSVAGRPSRVGTEYTSVTPKATDTANPLGAAIDLVGLLRTDYTITATTVTAGPSELSTLIAAHLLGTAAPMVDGLGILRDSAIVQLLGEAADARDAAAAALARLDIRLAPATDELADARKLVADREQAWATAVAEGKGSASLAGLKAAAEDAAGRLRRLNRGYAPARAFSAQAHEVISQVDAGIAALTQAPAGGEAPIVTALRRERLQREADEGGVTHVLYASLDTVAADAVTRRSILGTSGLLRFLSAGNASWLLLDAATGDLAAGGQVSLADTMTYSLDSGQMQFDPSVVTPRSAAAKLTDPLVTLEGWARGVILLLAVALFLLGVGAVVAVVT